MATNVQSQPTLLWTPKHNVRVEDKITTKIRSKKSQFPSYLMLENGVLSLKWAFVKKPTSSCGFKTEFWVLKNALLSNQSAKSPLYIARMYTNNTK